MQFVCDSCKAMLQIADEKVRGKRLVVRCKKCGAKISISDPGLGATMARVVARAEPGPQPAAPAPAAPAPAVPAPAAPAPASAPAAPAPAAAAPLSARSAAESERDSDTESTRAMDSDLLEKALLASKREEAPPAAAPSKRGAAAPEPARAAAPPRDPAVWFAMLGGKQTGPMTRAEIGLKAAQGAVGPRTYLWKEGMGAWTRAKDVAEVEALFAQEPGPAAPPPAPAARELAARAFSPSEAAPGSREPRRDGREAATQDFGSIDPAGDRESSAAAARGGGGPGSGRSGSASGTTPSRSAAPSSTSAPAGSAAQPGAAAHSGAGALAGSAGAVAGPASAARTGAASTVASARAAEVSRAPAGAAPSSELSAGAGSAAKDPGGDEPVRPPGRGAAVADVPPDGDQGHVDRVAAELFTPAESSGQSAVELARWASSELGKQPLVTPALAPDAPRADPFSQVTEAPALVEKPRVDRTGEVLAFAGVQRSRTPLVVAVVLGALLAGGGLLWTLSSEQAQSAKVEATPAVPADAGTAPAPAASSGDPAISALAAKAAAPPATDRAGDKPARKSSDSLTSDQQADLKSLDNERGVGTHGPRAAQTAETPDVERADVGLTAEDVRKKLGQSKGALQGCIDEALRREPNLRVGKIHIATTIAPSGSVTATKIDKQTVDQSLLGTCLKRATRRIVFPAFQGDAFEVDIPIVVTAGE